MKITLNTSLAAHLAQRAGIPLYLAHQGATLRVPDAVGAELSRQRLATPFRPKRFVCPECGATGDMPTELPAELYESIVCACCKKTIPAAHNLEMR